MLKQGLLGVAAIFISSALWAADSGEFTPTEMKWATAPNSLPKGAMVTILEGDLSKAEPFTIRLKTPAGYTIPPHWHPVIEHVTVISGEFEYGMGDTYDLKKAKKFPVGSFVFMPAESHHFAHTPTETVLQLHGVGPWGITYVNPKDDPRNQ